MRVDCRPSPRSARRSVLGRESVGIARAHHRSRLSALNLFPSCAVDRAAMWGKVFYNCPGRCMEMQAFSGLRWKTHVLDGASEIAKKRKCGLLNQSHTRSISC
jgi:hypothetical protein